MPHFDATSLPRLIQCGGSRSMPGFTPPGMETSDDVLEGNAAHWLANEYLSGREPDLFVWANRKAPNGVYITEEIIDCVEFYTGTVNGFGDIWKYTEHAMEWQPGPFTVGCRADYIGDNVSENPQTRIIRVVDYKHGWRIVEPDMNFTLIAHAIAYGSNRVIPPAATVEFWIVQPRPFSPYGKARKWSVPYSYLLQLRDYVIAQLSSNSETLASGPHCYKCPSRSFCPALRKSAMAALDYVEAKLPDQMSNDELSFMSDALDVAADRLKQYQAAINERIADAIKNGQPVRNYIAQTVSGSREWLPGIDAETLRLLAPGKSVSTEKLITPAQAKKFMPETIVDSMSTRKPGGMKIVRVDAGKYAEKLFGKESEQ